VCKSEWSLLRRLLDTPCHKGGGERKRDWDHPTTSLLLGRKNGRKREKKKDSSADASRKWNHELSHGQHQPRPRPPSASLCRRLRASPRRSHGSRRWRDVAGAAREAEKGPGCPPPPSRLLGSGGQNPIWHSRGVCLMDGRHPASSAPAQSARRRYDAGLRNLRFTPAAMVDGLGPLIACCLFFHSFFHFGPPDCRAHFIALRRSAKREASGRR